MQKVLIEVARDLTRGVIRIFIGWGKSLVELVKGIFWVIRHPLKTISRILALVVGALRVIFKLHRAGAFLRESLYEPYKAMTTLAVTGAFVLVGASFVENEQAVAVGTILLSASGIAYLLWRSIEFYHGNHHTADGIDGFILVTELMPFLGGLAVVSRLARMEGLITRVEGFAARAEGVLARTQGALSRVPGTTARSVSITGRVASRGGKLTRSAKIVGKTGKITKSVETAIQPAVSVGEWLTHWVHVSDEFLDRVIRTVKNVGRKIRK